MSAGSSQRPKIVCSGREKPITDSKHGNFDKMCCDNPDRNHQSRVREHCAVTQGTRLSEKKDMKVRHRA